jgi:threonyl-tRNA synthetase
VRILPITDAQLDTAREIETKLKAAKIRCSIDSHSDKFGAKIRRAEMDRVPYMFVLGKNEVAEGNVTIRSRVNKEDEGTVPTIEAVDLILTRIAEKALPVA